MNTMIAWFARNSVAANLLMVFIILMGANGIVNRLPVEVFPDFNPDEVRISVTYRGATPEQMEESIVIPLENAVADLPGIEEIKSTAVEGRCYVEIEVESDHNPRDVLDDVKSRVEAVSGLPEGIEPPEVKVDESLHEVVTLILHGDMSVSTICTNSASEYAMRSVGRKTSPGYDYAAYAIMRSALR